MSIQKKLVIEAQKSRGYDFSNKILYDLCSQNPSHEEEEIIIAKVLMIGRVYAAAIERRKDGIKYRDYYTQNVAPNMKNVDKILRPLTEGSENTSEETLRIHKEVQEVFKVISNQNKPSLTSKYLHFHFPDLFYIFDSVANNKSRRVLKNVCEPISYKTVDSVDNEYSKFYQRCAHIRKTIKDQTGVDLNPRHLDNLFQIYP